MLLSLYLRFSTKPGQNLKIAGNIPQLGGGNFADAVPMIYHDQQHWRVDIQLSSNEIKKFPLLQYTYIYTDDQGNMIEDWGEYRRIDWMDTMPDTIVLDTWIDMGSIENNFYTTPFKELYASKRKKTFKRSKSKHILLKVFAPMLGKEEQLVVVGNNKYFGNWTPQKGVKMNYDGSAWIAQVDKLTDASFLEYKYCVLNKDGAFLRYEHGSNRVLSQPLNDTSFLVQDGFARLDDRFRGTGLAIPVFSLRTKKSFGVGEFNDIKTLVDWASKVSIKMIQLLPVNDCPASTLYFNRGNCWYQA
ncbi:MAG: 4-alpha-glucanotransferase [Chitinophagaceae bacterium]|nr:4-alpha-glucanotransferase [Chitinophagaceae bacterium]